MMADFLSVLSKYHSVLEYVLPDFQSFGAWLFKYHMPNMGVFPPSQQSEGVQVTATKREMRPTENEAMFI